MGTETGFHYTSYENWLHIQSEGLVPYPIRKKEFNEFFPDGLMGVWVWQRELIGDEHIGSVLWQLATKSSTRLVKLQVEYNLHAQVKTASGDTFTILHDGVFGDWKYHHGAEAIVIAETIPPEHIYRLATYDLTEMFQQVSSMSAMRGWRVPR